MTDKSSGLWSGTFAARFKELVGDTPYRELSDKLGISKSTISAYLNGTRVPKVSALTAIADAYGVDPMWLMGTDVPKYKHKKESSNARVILDVDVSNSVAPAPAIPFIRVPRVGAIACGEPILAEQNVEGYDQVPIWTNCDFTLVCKGDSMIGARIFDGDVVCIHAQPEVESGEIAAVLVDDEATLKRVKKYPDHIILEPENPNYRPLVFWDAEMEKVRILGKATHFISEVR